MLLEELVKTVPYDIGIALVVFPVFLLTTLFQMRGSRTMNALEWAVGTVLFFGLIVSFTITGEGIETLGFLYFGLFHIVWPIATAGSIFYWWVYPDINVTARYMLLGWATANILIALVQIGGFPLRQIIFRDMWPPFFGYALVQVFIIPVVLFMGAGIYYGGDFKNLP